MFGVKDKVLLKKRQGLFIQRTGLLKGITRSFHQAFQGSGSKAHLGVFKPKTSFKKPNNALIFN